VQHLRRSQREFDLTSARDFEFGISLWLKIGQWLRRLELFGMAV
jgi:hypothetical protein